MKVRFFHQKRGYTCGPASLKMVFDFFGLKMTEEKIAKIAKTHKSGTSHLHIINTARKEGFYCYVHGGATISQIKHFIDFDLPVIVNYIEQKTKEGHYAVVIGYDRHGLILNDPWDGGHYKIKYKEFYKNWYDYHGRDKYSRWFIVLSREKFNVGKQYGPL